MVPAAPPRWRPPRPYHHALRRSEGGNAWRGIVALVLLGLGFFVLQLPATVALILSGDSLEDMTMTPAVLLAANLGLAGLWPLSMLIERILYGVKFRFVHSVAGKIRWRLFGILAAVLVPVYLLYVVASPLLFPGEEVGAFTTAGVGFIVVALLTTPLQSAGEEVFFRGTLPRVVGGWFASHRLALVVGTVVATLFFALAHGAGDMWLNVYYLVFGVSMVIVTWRTQGLEGAIIAHAANNTFLMVYSAVMGGDFDEMFEREAGTGGPFMLFGMAMCILAAALVWWRTRTTRAREAMQLPEGITPNPWSKEHDDDGPPPGYAGSPQYGVPQYGVPQYGPPQALGHYGAPQYGTPPYNTPHYGAPQDGGPQVPGQYGQPQPPPPPAHAPVQGPGQVPGQDGSPQPPAPPAPASPAGSPSPRDTPPDQHGGWAPPSGSAPPRS